MAPIQKSRSCKKPPAKKQKDVKKKTPAALNGADWRYSDAKKKIAQDILDG